MHFLGVKLILEWGLPWGERWVDDQFWTHWSVTAYTAVTGNFFPTGHQPKKTTTTTKLLGSSWEMDLLHLMSFMAKFQYNSPHTNKESQKETLAFNMNLNYVEKKCKAQSWHERIKMQCKHLCKRTYSWYIYFFYFTSPPTTIILLSMSATRADAYSPACRPWRRPHSLAIFK